jgi:U3 small nucleolar RNA-associated protein 10
VQQVAVCVRLGGSAEGKALVTECLVALTDSVADDALLKSLNLDLLMHTRSDDARLRLFALTCATALWSAHGGKLLGSHLSYLHSFSTNSHSPSLCIRDDDLHCGM